jgi:hypothetical protein
MNRSVQTTKIEKKYKDKKTGEWKSLTIDFAKVNDRLMEFRKEHPRGKISTRSQDDASGRTKFKAYVWKDKSDYIEMLKHVTDPEVALLTADADASARNSTTEEKDFEKLETIAVGRALAYLGYSVGGEIASSEEMDEFYGYQEEKFQKLIDKAEKREDFISILGKMNADQKKHFTPIINKRIQELKDAVPAN